MRPRGPLVLGTALLLASTATPALAQNGFLFQRPMASLTLRAGPVMHSVGGDVFDFMTTELTLDRGDFRAPSFGADLAIALTDRVDIVVGLSRAETETRSESREWVGEDDLPIEQVTRFMTLPITGSLRFYPMSRVQRISDLAWVPARTTPYLGGGGGIVAYRLEQEGEFVDEADLSIFTDEFTSKGSGWTAHALAGVDHWFSPRVALNVEGRYTLGSASPEGDFRSGPGGEWESIDLGGFQAGVGLSFRW
jgi:hypothetical protein